LPSEERGAANLRVAIDVNVERGACADGAIGGDKPGKKNVVVRGLREKRQRCALVRAYQTLNSGLC
jgi:hypothetical protein